VSGLTAIGTSACGCTVSDAPASRARLRAEWRATSGCAARIGVARELGQRPRREVVQRAPGAIGKGKSLYSFTATPDQRLTELVDHGGGKRNRIRRVSAMLTSRASTP